VEAEDFPTVIMFDEIQKDFRFALLKSGVGLVGRSDGSGLPQDGRHMGLTFRRVALHNVPELPKGREEPVTISGRDNLLQFRTGPVEESILVPVSHDCRDGGIGVSAALVVESRASDSQQGYANDKENDQDAKEGAHDDEELLHRADERERGLTARFLAGLQSEGNTKVVFVRNRRLPEFLFTFVLLPNLNRLPSTLFLASGFPNSSKSSSGSD
jgi:hypothetical protein